MCIYTFNIIDSFSWLQETFYDDRDLYLPLLTTQGAAEAGGAATAAPYQRVVDDSEEAPCEAGDFKVTKCGNSTRKPGDLLRFHRIYMGFE